MRANFINSRITNLAIHIVGNKIADEGMVLSKSCLTISNDLEDTLSTFFLGAFSSDEYYHLRHDTSLNLNEVFSYVSEIFDNHESLYTQSMSISQY